jgi:hypothetical protein
MDAKYNKYIDSVAVRVTLNVAAWLLWLGSAVFLLSL